MRRVDKFLATITILGILFWLFVILAAPEPFYGAYYYLLLFTTLGALLWYRWEAVKAWLQRWGGGSWKKFLIIGYATVLYEEILAAFANHWTEGFSFPLYLERITEFWALNIFAFTGFILGWYFLTKRYQYTYREIFYLAAFWGLFAEKVYAHVAFWPGMLALIGPSMVSYGIIAMPMVLTVLPGQQRSIGRIKKYFITYIVIFMLSIIPILMLGALRDAHPDAFPPETMVPR